MKKPTGSLESILMSKKTRTALAAALIVGMFATLMVVNLLTPPLADDYVYISDKGQVFGEDAPMRNVSDVIRSVTNRYMMNSGRIFTSISYIVFFSLLNKTSIAFINSAAYMLTAWFLYLIIRGKGKNSFFLFLGGVNLSLWAFVPELGQDIFWVSGTVNYLLPMLPILGMILLYRRGFGSSSGKDGAAKCVCMALLGVAAGCQVENSSIAVPVVTLAYICLWKHKGIKVPKWAWCGFAGSVLGYILLIAAPGNYQRYENEVGSVSLSLPFKFAMITYYWVMFVGVLTVLFVLAVIKCRRSNPTAVYEGAIFAAAALITAYCMMASPTSPERTWFITVSLMTAAAGIVLREAFPLEKTSFAAKTALCMGALVILGAMAADTVLASYDIHEQFIQREEMILAAKQKGETVVTVPVYELKYPLKANRYALYGLYDIELGQNSPNSFNKSAARYYGIDAIIGTSGQ